MDSESRPETQNSDRTVINNGQPSYITSEKADIKQNPLLKKDAAEMIKVISRIENYNENDLNLPRFGSVVEKSKSDFALPQESQEGENVE